MRKCISPSATDTKPGTGQSPWREVRDCFELLFALLSHIEGGNNDVLAFSDHGSLLDVGVNWRVLLPVYFEWLAETESASPEEFASTMDAAIRKFAQHNRPPYMNAAHTAEMTLNTLPC
jgi:hypothetical protein